MSDDYYDRSHTTSKDGVRGFCSSKDRTNEEEVAAAITAKWKCEVKLFGSLCPIDFYLLKDGLMYGLAEVKSRSHASTKYPTVFLNVRKWLALQMGQAGLNVPAVFVVRFLDQIKYIPLKEIDASRVQMGGCANYVKSHTDIEPVIHVPIDAMKTLKELA